MIDRAAFRRMTIPDGRTRCAPRQGRFVSVVMQPSHEARAPVSERVAR